MSTKTAFPKAVALFTLPNNPEPSARFRQRFNAVAQELKIGLEWVRDEKDPLAVNADELKIAATDLKKYKSTQPTPKIFNDALVTDVRKVLTEVERQRLKKVEESARFHKRVAYRAPLENLNRAERKAVELFQMEVKPPLNRIVQKQEDPSAPMLGAWLVHHGDYYSQILFGRFHRDVCAEPFSSDMACSLAPFFPDLPAISGMMGPGVTLEKFLELGKTLSPSAEELRPTTLLELKDGKIIATPLPLHPQFREDHLELAAALEKIATLNVDGDALDPKLRDQLKKWALFFRTGKARDEAIAAQATIDAGEGGGMLRVHIGPSESYWADNTKFPYLLQVGIRNPKVMAEMSQGSDLFPELEASLAGIPSYTPRKLSTRGGFADPIYQAITGGFFETFSSREPLGNNFPNYEGYHAEGSNRFIVMEGMEETAPQIKTILSRLLDEDVSSLENHHLTYGTVDHESGHLLGPQRSHITPSGKKMGAVFGIHWGSADEPKADLTEVVKIRLALQKGRITEEEAVSCLKGYLGWSLSNRYKGKKAFPDMTDHYFGHLLEVGYYFQTGALSLVHGKIHADWKKLLETGHDLWRKIIAFQAAGDLKGFLDFSRETVARIPDEADRIILEASKDMPMMFIERHL